MTRTEELKGMAISELRTICKELGIRNYANFKKAEYVERILEAESFEVPTEPEKDIFDELTVILPDMVSNIAEKKARGESIEEVVARFVNFYLGQKKEIDVEIAQMKATGNKPNDTIGTFEAILASYEAKSAAYNKKVEAVEMFGMEKLEMSFEIRELTPADFEATSPEVFTKEVIENVVDGNKVKTEIFKSSDWVYRRMTVNNFFKKAEFEVFGEIKKVAVPSKKHIQEELKDMFGVDVKLK